MSLSPGIQRLFILAGACSLLASGGPFAQSLDEEIERLLADNCSALGTDGSNGQFGSALAAICGIPQTGTASSAGGGAASPQASALSFQNSIVQERLERARGKSGDTASHRGAGHGSANARLSASFDSSNSAGSGSSISTRRFDFFVAAGYGTLDRDATSFEDGYDSTMQSASVGVDYLFSDTLAGGLLLGYRKQDGDFIRGGDLETTAFEPLLFLSYLPSDRSFVQFLLGYGDESTDVNRNVAIDLVEPNNNNTREIRGFAASDSDASVLSAALTYGYDRNSGKFTYGPRIGLNYRETDLDGYSELGTSGVELIVRDRTVESQQATIGFYGSAAYSRKSGIIVPQFTVEYVKEFEDDASLVAAQFAQDLRGANATVFNYLTNAPDSDFVNVDLGVSAVLASGLQPYVSIRTLVGSDNFDSVVGTIGVRFGG